MTDDHYSSPYYRAKSDEAIKRQLADARKIVHQRRTGVRKMSNRDADDWDDEVAGLEAELARREREREAQWTRTFWDD